jgi:hypothetical protein
VASTWTRYPFNDQTKSDEEKAKDAARRAEAAVIYGKGDVTVLRAAHAAAQAAVREAVEKQKKLGALSTVQPVERD